MKPVDFKGSNHDFGKPKDWNEEKDGKCGSLPVNNNGTTSWSCWELDENDIKDILEHKKIWLGIWGGQNHPVVSVHPAEPLQVTQFNWDKAKLKTVYLYIGNEEGAKPQVQDMNHWMQKGYTYTAFEDEHAITLSKTDIKLDNHCAYSK